MDTKHTVSSHLKQIGVFLEKKWDENVLKVDNELYLCAALYTLGTVGDLMEAAARFTNVTIMAEQAKELGVNGIKSLVLNQATKRNPFLQLRNCLFDHFHRINNDELFKRICKPAILKELMSFKRFDVASFVKDEVKLKFLLEVVTWADANIDTINKHTVDTIIKLEYITVCLSKCSNFKNCTNASETMITSSINMLLIIAGTCAREILEYKGSNEILLTELKKEHILSIRDTKNKKINRTTSVFEELTYLKRMRDGLAHYGDTKGKEIVKFVKDLPFADLLSFFKFALDDMKKSMSKETKEVKLFGTLSIPELPIPIVATSTPSTIIDNSSMEPKITKEEILITPPLESSITISQKQIDEKAKLQQEANYPNKQQEYIQEEKSFTTLETIVSKEVQEEISEIQKNTLKQSEMFPPKKEQKLPSTVVEKQETEEPRPK